MAATYVQRWDVADGGPAAFFSVAQKSKHPEEKMIVIDWMTITLGSTAGGNCSFIISDSSDTDTLENLTGYLYKVTFPVAAGDSDTMHVTFPGGFPLRQVYQEVPSNHIISNGAAEMPVGFTSITWSTSIADSGQVFIGYHLERTSNRS